MEKSILLTNTLNEVIDHENKYSRACLSIGSLSKFWSKHPQLALLSSFKLSNSLQNLPEQGGF